MTSRKSRSVDDVVDYDVLKITEFKGPFYNTDFNAISELGSPGGSKVRYNDTGSIEQLDEDNLDSLDFYEEFEMDSLRLDESDDTETLNGTQKYRELWNLRTTFEEEEECSDTIRMEDMTSPDQSPEGDMPQYYTTSFESNTESIPYTDNSDKQRKLSVLSVDIPKPLSSNLLHPNYENRRQTYKNILARRFLPAAGGVSAETSIDSVETVDTDGEVSDTSRYEVTTTSFDSTTDNTDSANESQNHRLIQMKADSGYKSLETQPFLHGAVKRNHSTGEIEEETEDLDDVTSSDRVFKHAHSLPEPGPSGSRFFDRRNGKTASKKRREYSREKQIVHVYESINEPETDSKSDQPSGESFEETPPVNKLSMFSRFFKPYKDVKHRASSLVRDYSIDEKTNRVFQEFLRYDPKLDSRVGAHHGRPHRIHRHRLHRKHSDVKYFEERRRDRLTPDLRSTSLGSDSSTSSVRRLSPQDSIEEEDYDEMREEEEWERQMQQREIQQRQSVSIPIIKLPEEEATNV
ncbi:hypothetical protein FSP39_024777 [Pinctada imbricata]|uniref:Uncharacterized protein n=1 Tax=Pinctada imbricata TaxID=66713 RepID=A0AA88XUK4_PINIB|nr:hypothetical protein FSP39_024777 [Pinctada imbricata]